ncbi:hypothetical protein BaRGS_00011618, partial [Batillaria attramentaria]
NAEEVTRDALNLTTTPSTLSTTRKTGSHTTQCKTAEAEKPVLTTVPASTSQALGSALLLICSASLGPLDLATEIKWYWEFQGPDLKWTAQFSGAEKTDRQSVKDGCSNTGISILLMNVSLNDKAPSSSEKVYLSTISPARRDLVFSKQTLTCEVTVDSLVHLPALFWTRVPGDGSELDEAVLPTRNVSGGQFLFASTVSFPVVPAADKIYFVCIASYDGMEVAAAYKVSVDQNDACGSAPCQNKARCVDTYVGFECICPSGFEGTYCEYDIRVRIDFEPWPATTLTAEATVSVLCCPPPSLHRDDLHGLTVQRRLKNEPVSNLTTLAELTISDDRVEVNKVAEIPSSSVSTDELNDCLIYTLWSASCEDEGLYICTADFGGSGIKGAERRNVSRNAALTIEMLPSPVNITLLQPATKQFKDGAPVWQWEIQYYGTSAWLPYRPVTNIQTDEAFPVDGCRQRQESTLTRVFRYPEDQGTQLRCYVFQKGARDVRFTGMFTMENVSLGAFTFTPIVIWVWTYAVLAVVLGALGLALNARFAGSASKKTSTRVRTDEDI